MRARTAEWASYRAEEQQWGRTRELLHAEPLPGGAAVVGDGAPRTLRGRPDAAQACAGAGGVTTWSGRSVGAHSPAGLNGFRRAAAHRHKDWRDIARESARAKPKAENKARRGRATTSGPRRLRGLGNLYKRFLRPRRRTLWRPSSVHLLPCLILSSLPANMVLLVTSDNEQFVVDKEVAERSVLIKNMLEGASHTCLRPCSAAHVPPSVTLQMSARATSRSRSPMFPRAS